MDSVSEITIQDIVSSSKFKATFLSFIDKPQTFINCFQDFDDEMAIILSMFCMILGKESPDLSSLVNSIIKLLSCILYQQHLLYHQAKMIRDLVP
jgi:hypothetical protein